MPTSDPIRWGICGTGRIAERFVESLAAVPDARVVAVASRTPGRAEQLAWAAGARTHGSQAALADDDEVDVVYVATTHDDHHAATVGFLDAGRHVLCEKPLAVNARQARDMVAAAERNERFLMEAMWSRFQPGYRRLGELLAEGRIGRPLSLEADFAFRSAEGPDGDHRLVDPARGGGALLDLGIYPLQLSQLVFGEPDRTRAVATLTDRGVDIETAVVLGYPDGASARVFTSLRVDGTCTARIAGERGAITIQAFMHCPTELHVQTRDGVEVLRCDPPSLHHQVPEVHACIRRGELQSSIHPWADSVALATTMDEIRRQTGVRYPAD